MQKYENEKQKLQLGSPKSKYSTITSNDQINYKNQDNLGDILNLGFGDSAS